MSKDIEIHQLRITVERYEELAKLKDLKVGVGVGTEEIHKVSR